MTIKFMQRVMHKYLIIYPDSLQSLQLQVENPFPIKYQHFKSLKRVDIHYQTYKLRLIITKIRYTSFYF